MASVTPEERKAAFATTKSTKASGPAGRKLTGIKALGDDQICWLMNLVFKLGTLFESWSVGVLCCFQKVDAPALSPDCRLLILTLVLTKIFHRVLSKRLATASPLPLKHKGLKREEGCAASLLMAALQAAKATPKSYCMALNFRKISDSVGHPAIVTPCKR